MKKVSILLAFTFLIIFLSSCLRTLHPIFTTKDIVYEPKLIGSWKTESQGTKGFVTITNLAVDNSIELPEKISTIKQKGYLISYQQVDGKATEQYIAFLARIGKHLYFDYFPADKKDNKTIDEFFASHFVKMHTSYRLDISKDGSFELSQLDESYVTKLIDEKKIRISHEKDVKGNIVITASTDELQQYILKYGDEPGAYRSEKTVFTKIIHDL
ncbi:MAG TPA: hypothetical protein VFZ33_05610 [Chitinophagaceae bacterium]